MVSNDIDMLGLTRRVANKAVKNKRTSIAVGAGELPEPKSMVEALMSDRAEGWVESINKEMQGLMDQQVFSKGWTLRCSRRQAFVATSDLMVAGPQLFHCRSV